MNIEKAQVILLLAQTAEVLGRIPGSSDTKVLQQLDSLLTNGLPKNTPPETCDCPECKEDAAMTVEELRKKYTYLDLRDILQARSKEKDTTMGELRKYAEAAGLTSFGFIAY